VPDAESGADEFALIARHFYGLDAGPAVTLGNGDDAALLRLGAGEELAVSVDCMVEGVHFPVASAAQRIAYRAVAAAVSDLAAMAARPLAMTCSLTLPSADDSWLADFRLGLTDACEQFSLPLVGGDLTRGALTVSIQVLGGVPAGAALRRRGAAAGDRVCVSGALGDAAAGLAVIQGQLDLPPAPAAKLQECFWRPRPDLELGLALRGRASAAIDVSDGLLADAGHMAAASGVRLSIDSESLPLSLVLAAAVPREQALDWALAGGEDYRLCFTLPPAFELPDGCVCIGSVEAGQGVSCDRSVQASGYQHF
jgi:thiamine-monophosphate kinase